MTREQKIAEAQRLRDEGFRFREIAKKMGLAGPSTAWGLVNPERYRAQNLARNGKKRARERESAGDCRGCGTPLNDPRASLCPECRRGAQEGAARERTERFIALRKQGLLNGEIAEREGVRRYTVAMTLSRAGRYGLEVPPSPWFAARKVTA